MDDSLERDDQILPNNDEYLVFGMESSIVSSQGFHLPSCLPCAAPLCSVETRILEVEQSHECVNLVASNTTLWSLIPVRQVA